MTGDATRDDHATEHHFIGGEDNDYVAAQQADAVPCRCWQQRPIPHSGHCCMRDVSDDGETACGHTDPREVTDA